MRIFFRIVAIATMFVALIQLALAVSRQFDEDRPQSTASTVRHSTTDKINRISSNLFGPLELFCSGAILFVLIRISTTQEDDAPIPPSLDAGAAARKERP
jgi:hypothetical protein